MGHIIQPYEVYSHVGGTPRVNDVERCCHLTGWPSDLQASFGCLSSKPNWHLLSGWWFGTFFSHILVVIIPNDKYCSEGLKPPTSWGSASLCHCVTGLFKRHLFVLPSRPHNMPEACNELGQPSAQGVAYSMSQLANSTSGELDDQKLWRFAEDDTDPDRCHWCHWSCRDFFFSLQDVAGVWSVWKCGALLRHQRFVILSGACTAWAVWDRNEVVASCRCLATSRPWSLAGHAKTCDACGTAAHCSLNARYACFDCAPPAVVASGGDENAIKREASPSIATCCFPPEHSSCPVSLESWW